MSKDNKSEKTTYKSVDERLAQFERDLNRFDAAMKGKKDKIRSDMDELEDEFEDFMEDLGLDMDDMKKQFDEEMNHLKKEIEFTGQALKKSFRMFQDEFKTRKSG